MQLKAARVAKATEGVAVMTTAIKAFEAKKAARLLELEQQLRAAEAEYDGLIGWAREVREGCAEKLAVGVRQHLAAAEKLATLP